MGALAVSATVAALISCQNSSSNQPTPTADSSAKVVADSISKDSIAKAMSFDSTKKYIFLTFDDGPQPGTGNVVKVLEALNVPATFFMIGEHYKIYGKEVSSYKDSVEAHYPQMLLATHSFSHAFNDHYQKFYHSPEAAFADFDETNKALGAPYKIVRLPGNPSWAINGKIRSSHLTKPVTLLLDSAGYSVVGWDSEWHFKRDPQGGGSVPIQSAEKMASQLIYEAENSKYSFHKNCIVLLAHDRMFRRDNYRDSLAKMITIVKTQHPEYQFRTMEQYPRIKLVKN